MDVGVIVSSLVIMLALYLFFRWTKTGMAMRATSQSQTAAQLMRVSVKQIFSLTWAISAAIGGIAGVLIALIIYLNPNLSVTKICGWPSRSRPGGSCEWKAMAPWGIIRQCPLPRSPRRAPLTAHAAESVQQGPQDFHALVTSVTGAAARGQPASTVAVPLFRRRLARGAVLLRVFFGTPERRCGRSGLAWPQPARLYGITSSAPRPMPRSLATSAWSATTSPPQGRLGAGRWMPSGACQRAVTPTWSARGGVGDHRQGLAPESAGDRAHPRGVAQPAGPRGQRGGGRR
jgi:Branched-chain amino acid transport system / permease component